MDTVTADRYLRVRIPDARPGQVFTCQNNGDGTFVLTIVKPDEPFRGKVKFYKKNGHTVAHAERVTFIKKDGFTVGHTKKQVSPEQIKELLADFP